MIGIIVAMNADRIIGVNGDIPWRKEAYARTDQKRFKAVTMGSTVIMGRKTWESIPAKYRPLVGRRNVVLSSSIVAASGVETVGSIRAALHAGRGGDAWFIGGARIYAEAMHHADVIDVTWVPWETPKWIIESRDAMVSRFGGDLERVKCVDASDIQEEAIFFPPIDESVFAPGPVQSGADIEPALASCGLMLQRFERRYSLKDNEALRQKGLLSR